MAPFEYRVCAEPHATYQQSWNVSIWTRHFSSNPEDTAWVCRHRVLVRGEDWPHAPKAVWPLLLRALKV